MNRVSKTSIVAVLSACGWVAPALSQQAGGQAPQPQAGQQGQMRQQAQKPEHPQLNKASSAEVEAAIRDWKEQPRKVAQDIMKKYGPPHEVTEYRLVWHDNGPWKRTELINEEIDHQFPLPHKDMLYQVVNFEVPTDKVDEILAFDGSVIVERTRGELGARCDKEPANFLAVNLAREIAMGKRTVDEARQIYAEQIVALASNEPAPLTAKLNFDPQRTAGDPGKQVIPQSVAEKLKDKMKEMGAAR